MGETCFEKPCVSHQFALCTLAERAHSRVTVKNPPYPSMGPISAEVRTVSGEPWILLSGFLASEHISDWALEICGHV